MTIEEAVRDEFERKGIEVTIIEDGFLANTCIVDTTKHDKQIRTEVIEEAKKICGGKIPSYTNCAYCLFATFKDDFDTTICKLEQLKEQNK